MFEPFPGNYSWNLSTNIALNTGAQLNEVLDAIAPVIPLAEDGDSATGAYLKAYAELGDRLVSLAEEDLAAGHRLSAANKFERAAVYYVTGERVQSIGDEARKIAYQKMLDAFAAFIDNTDQDLTPVEVPFGDTSFPGLYFQAAVPEGSAHPVMVHFNGLDSTKEMMWGAPLGRELARRGISSLMIDQPGTGEALRLRGLHSAHNSEVWASAAVNYLLSRGDVDPDRVGIVGWSLAGYYVPRAAAFEKRFKLAATWGANYNWGELQKRRAEREGENPVPHYWEHVQWVFDKPNREEFMKFAPRMSLESVIGRITVPFLVTHGEHDRQIPLSYARAQYENAVNSPDRELKIFTDRDGGVEHVGGDNMWPASCYIADWVTERL